ncbi:hypothetical protein [Polyangium aurulentum]|uniref:hypothetical protein n=1 Tax=Polyangium aurulentum TaxID=2567896 RepID=UPI0010AE7BE0|nr:hypothetical protein [Polyangium aurulentum]UQA62064.1 hypothetical protein E8A73_016945 [Polyangium aurulentum]
MRRSCGVGALVLVAALGSLSTGCVAPDGQVGTKGPGTGIGAVVGFEEVWAKSFGYELDPNTNQRTNDVAVSRDGQVLVVAMEFEGGIKDADLTTDPHYGLGKSDLLIAAYKADGSAPLWARRVGDTEKQEAPSIAIDSSNNVIVAGGFESYLDFENNLVVQSKGAMDAFVAKLDATGKAVWVRGYGDMGTEFVTDVAVDASGNVIIVGFTNGKIDFGGGDVPSAANDDIFVAKLSPAGEHLWGQRIGKAGSYGLNEPTVSVGVMSDGRVVVAGFAGEELKVPNLDLPDRGDKTAFLVMFDSEGNGKWGKTWGATNAAQRLFGLSVSPSGAIAIAGDMQGTISFSGDKNDNFASGSDRDVFVAVFDDRGAHKWSQGFGSLGTQTAWDVAFDTDDNLFVAGEFSGAIELHGEDTVLNASVADTPTDAFVVQFDPTGEALRAKGYGRNESQNARAIAVDGAGNAYVGGFFRGNIDFTGKTLTSTGGEDAFILELSP